MKTRFTALLLVVLCAAAVRAQMTMIPLWAYGYIAYPSMPGDYTQKCQGDRADPCAPRGGLPPDPNNPPRTLRGSDRPSPVAQNTPRYTPADCFPPDPPPMPDI